MNAFTTTSAQQAAGSQQEHRAARLALLAREKELNKLRDELAAQRRQLPWEPLEKTYEFDGPDGRLSMLDLFGDHSQLIVYHFMLGPGWVEGCPSCSYWADSFDGMPVHLASRDAALVAVSRAPFAEIEAYRQRMGWSFRWVSSAPGDFNFDFGVSSTPEHQAAGREYNFRRVDEPMEESPGLSVFARDEAGQVYHTYSTYSRGLDPINSGYQLLDLTPKGRDEQDLPWTMAWLRRHDSY
jgi:predicted dithiol-disulfide oxidoreductase (DUF899 family)